jgi:hypothetical protein
MLCHPFRFPRSPRAVGALTMTLALVGAPACSDDETDPNGVTDVQWAEAFDTSSAGSLSGVWGSGPNDVFVVGGDQDGAEIYHYDGGGWSPMAAPTLPLLVWVFGFGPDDVYTVGTKGGMAHYDGSSWTPIDTGTTEDLWGIFGFAKNDLWIVGGDPFDNDPLILHYDGSTFTPHVVDAAQNPQGAKSLFKVWGIGSELFAVGQKGLILRYDGTNWLSSPAGAEANQDFVSLWGTSESDIVAVGGRNNARVATYNGSGWDTVSPDALGGLNAVHMVEPGVAIVGGIFGFVGRFETATGQVIAEADSLTRVDVHAMWGDGQGKHYAVGGSFLEPHEGAALVRTAP